LTSRPHHHESTDDLVGWLIDQGGERFGEADGDSWVVWVSWASPWSDGG
jgi:hypothetical protein